ncbi:MAG: hypothetical protein F6K46_11770 [Moorea sp. SIO3E8]|nr:hypothetical protein [Moorena sp. SIO3E8]
MNIVRKVIPNQEKIENQKVRLIKPGGGAGQKLSIEDQIVGIGQLLS